MNSEFKFIFSKNGDLRCYYSDATDYRIFYGQEALDIFVQMDNLNFEHNYANDYTVKLIDKGISCRLENYQLFFRSHMLDYIPATKLAVRQAVEQYRIREMNKNKRKKLRQMKQVASKVMASALVMTILGAGIHALNKDDVTPELPIQPDKSIEVVLPDYRSSYEVDNNISIDKSLEDFSHEELLKDVTQIDENVAYLDFEHSFDTEKGHHAYDNYYDIVQKYATKWGISPNLIMSMLTQESGGYETNLMQIQFYSWRDQVIQVYNFNDNKWEKIVLTEDTQKFKNMYGNDIICISEKDLDNPITNISIGCVLFRESYRLMDHHVAAAIQCYNFGVGNMWSVFDEMERVTGEYPDLANQDDLRFLDYTYVGVGGDKNYVPHVSQYKENIDDIYSVKNVDQNGNIYVEEVNIQPSSRQLS